MNIRYKRNYRAMPKLDYILAVNSEMEKIKSNDELNLIFSHFNVEFIARVIKRSANNFQDMNLSPKYTAHQVIRIVEEVVADISRKMKVN